ncbi:ABC transporter permease [Candidatus Chloroploca sp. M-50]|uniref:ABC transporter permease n=1 Tax=Candidatus Chloroploca mongolica TaxID=2528176 RepID=A0ABS4D6M1_9CHLR|nr:ABC transporter permease [Candidatus Chloroploca mongolica]MBP1465088.1 ABC transporter permease [Candidatus Chloroploca mongolica]
MATAEQTAGDQLPSPPATSTSRWQRLGTQLGLFRRSRIALVGLCLVGFWVVVALFADNCLVTPACYAGIVRGDDITTWATSDEYRSWLSRYSPVEQFRGRTREGPSWDHWLGTDTRGRDIWARLAHGSRLILTLAPLSVMVALLIGGTLGLLAGYYGGMVDEVTMRILDAIIAFPQILLYLVIIASFGASATNVLIAITIAGAPGIARLVRGLTLDIKTRDYVAAAQTQGERSWYIMVFEILPNARGPIIIDSMLRVGYAVFSIGTLGFLGLGLPPPSPDWGSIVQAGRSSIQAGRPWEALWGSLAIAMVVVGLNLIADGMSEETRRYR